MMFKRANEAITGGRNRLVDALKGGAIISLVFAHSILLNDPHHDENVIFRVLMSFLMPLFMFLSGYIIHTQLPYPFLYYIRKNAVRLVLPFFVWHGISYLYFRAKGLDINILNHYLSLLKSPDQGLWFLWVLFWMSILLFGTLKFTRWRNRERWENVFVLIALLMTRFASTDTLGLAEIKQYFPYYLAGFLFWKYRKHFLQKQLIYYGLSFIIFPLLVYFWRRNAFPTFYPSLAEWLGSGIARLIVSIYKYVVSFTGMATFSGLFGIISLTRIYPFFSWVGTMSLDIYACHRYFIPLSGNDLGHYLLDASIAMVCSLLLTLLVMKRFRITRLLLLGQMK